MPDLSTKERILQASVQLFNENGLANVRLQQIADEIGISVGNLAYHYKNKEAIIGALNQQLNEEIAEILSTYRLFPNLLDFDQQLSKYFAFAQKYPFYFLELVEIERLNQSVALQRRQHISKMMSQIRKRFDFNQRRGIIKPEERAGSYELLANTIWVVISLWPAVQSVREGENPASIAQFKEMVWNLITPHLTDAGKAEFEQLIIPLLTQQN